jgi:competence transcription factor ComK
MQILERALVIVAYPNDVLIVYGENGFSQTLNQSINEYMQRRCRNFSIDMVTSAMWFKRWLGIRKNVPICMCANRKIVFFKIVCSVTRLPIWFRYSPKMKYKRIDGERFGIFIDQELIIEATFSKHKFDTQIKRVEEFFRLIIRCSNCTNLRCVYCIRKA